VVVILALAATLGLDSAAQRSYFDYGDEDLTERRRVLSTAFWVLLAASTTLAVTTIALRGPIAQALFGDREYATVLALAGGALPFTILSAFFLEILRMRRQPGRYSLVALFAGAAGVSLALALAGLAGRGLEGYYLGLLLGGSTAAMLGFVLVRGSLRPTFDGGKLRIMLAYGLPLVPVSAATWLLQFVDRFFLLRYWPLEELGLYGIGVRLANLLLLAVTAFSLAWSPFMLELHGRDPRLERAGRGQVLTLFAIALSFGALALAVYAHEILRIVTPPEYHDAYRVVGLLAASVVAVGINAVTASEISLKRRTIFFARYTAYAATLNVALNFLLIPPWGMVGAALATALSYGLLTILYWWRAQRLERAPFEARRILTVLAVAAGLAAAGTFVSLESLPLSVLVKLPLLLAFPVLLRLAGVLPRGWLGAMVAWARTFTRQGLRARARGDV
jgi:O-antigen/teichoic acid export membrane protein